jgi:transcriptional regulator with XRE-family HTH domain
MAKVQNVVGPQVRKLRYQQEVTQEALAARCGVLGWDLSRATLSKIEAQLRCVTDTELEILARALKVEIAALYPTKGNQRRK